MEQKKDVQQLIDDLLFVKKAISKNSNILKFIDVGGVLSRVVFASGLVTIFLAGAAYLLIISYGSFQEIPRALRGSLFLAVAALVAVTGIMKFRAVAARAKEGHADINAQRLIQEIYTPQALHILIPYVTAITLVTVFLVANGHTLYLVPALSILTGLLCLAYVNVFHMKELLVTGDWMLATGLLALFFAQTVHPLLALIVTFGLGFCSIYPANRYMGQRK